MLALEHTLRPVSRLEVNTVESGYGGVAGAFRYEAAMATGGISLLPTVRAVDRSAFTAPVKTGCYRRIADGPDRQARRVADMLERALP